jgi:hypothetical protein
MSIHIDINTNAPKEFIKFDDVEGIQGGFKLLSLQ